jgi:hypothetical protein
MARHLTIILPFEKIPAIPSEKQTLMVRGHFIGCSMTLGKKTLAGKEERFRFVGILNDTVALDIPFRIGADDCHVYKVSGPEEVTL